MKKISGVYKITNIITNDFYIGSSKNVKSRWAAHKCPSTWKNYSNKQLYQDMQKYGIEKFDFQILASVEPEQLKETEQEFIGKLHPTYNNYNAKGLDVEKIKKHKKQYQQSDKGKEYQKKYKQTEKYKEYEKRRKQTEKYKEYQKKYQNQYCSYNGKILTFSALYHRFYRAGTENPTSEAKKYLLDK